MGTGSGWPRRPRRLRRRRLAAGQRPAPAGGLGRAGHDHGPPANWRPAAGRRCERSRASGQGGSCAPPGSGCRPVRSAAGGRAPGTGRRAAGDGRGAARPRPLRARPLHRRHRRDWRAADRRPLLDRRSGARRRLDGGATAGGADRAAGGYGGGRRRPPRPPAARAGRRRPGGRGTGAVPDDRRHRPERRPAFAGGRACPRRRSGRLARYTARPGCCAARPRGRPVQAARPVFRRPFARPRHAAEQPDAMPLLSAVTSRPGRSKSGMQYRAIQPSRSRSCRTRAPTPAYVAIASEDLRGRRGPLSVPVQVTAVRPRRPAHRGFRFPAAAPVPPTATRRRPTGRAGRPSASNGTPVHSARLPVCGTRWRERSTAVSSPPIAAAGCWAAPSRVCRRLGFESPAFRYSATNYRSTPTCQGQLPDSNRAHSPAARSSRVAAAGC